MPPHDEDCIKIYSNAIFSEHSWVIGLADPHLRMLTKGSVFYLQIIIYGVVSTTFKHCRIRRRLIMQYFVIEKICKNACRLLCAGDSFEHAARFVSRANKPEYTYIISGPQMLNIFFSGRSQKHVNAYWKSYFDTCGDMQCLYMPLPVNFEECISDLNTALLVSNKVMDLD